VIMTGFCRQLSGKEARSGTGEPVGPGLGGGIGAGTFVFAGDRHEGSGQIGGVVVDPSAVVSGAHVTVTNSERGYHERSQ
jgi:hypothetical protein